jgi:cytochrome b561
MLFNNRITKSLAYDGVARALHWLMALLILAAFTLGLLVVEIHKVIGISILVLVAVRLGWRLAHRPPPAAPVGPLLDALSRMGHLALYILMVAVPVLGLVYAALRGQGIDFGIFAISPIMEGNRAVARPYREVHELAAYALVGLAGLHMLAGLWHHFIRRDGILRRMIPRLGRSPT